MSEVAPPFDASSRLWSAVLVIVIGFFLMFPGVVVVALFASGKSIFSEIFIALYRGFPVTQFLYVGPIAYRQYSAGQTKAMQGWLIGAAVSAVLYFPCWGIHY
jgi:hypothetical protein